MDSTIGSSDYPCLYIVQGAIMKAFISSLLSESSEVSCGRFMALLSLGFGGGLAVLGLYTGRDPNTLTPLVSIFVLSAFGGKVAQKFAEREKD